MGAIVYVLCALTSMGCAVLLMQSYRRSRTRLLLGSSVCFLFLALNNALLVVDMLIIETIDFSLPRAITGVLAVIIMLFTLIQGDRT